MLEDNEEAEELESEPWLGEAGPPLATADERVKDGDLCFLMSL